MMNVDKQEVIAVLKNYIEVLEEDNVRLDSVMLSSMPDYTEAYGDTGLAAYERTGDNFDIDFNVSYIK